MGMERYAERERHAAKAVYDIVLKRLLDHGELMELMLSVWHAGYAEGHMDGHNGARVADMAADRKTAQGR